LVTVVFLKKSLISGTFLSAILVAARVGEEEVCWSSALRVITDRLVSDGKIVINFHGHGVRNGSGAVTSEKLEGERMESDGTGCTHRRSVYMRSKQQCEDSLREKRVAFLLQPPA
jgi:hypothetical protein